ncbi:MAG: glycosyltransferase [Pseudomonadota bacterium]
MQDPAIRESELSFHLIYMPNTVRYLYPFVASLLRYSDSRFVLVSNNCSREEKNFISRECRNNSRLEFVDLPTKEVSWAHGRCLNYLYEKSDSDYFCFIDSDIFATGRFLPQFLPKLGTHACVSSCSSLWATEEDGKTSPFVKQLSGRHNQTPEGQCLATSYFAMYKRSSLEACRHLCSVDFRRVSWSDFPQSMHAAAEKNKLRKNKYDTAKMLNLALIFQGFSLFHEEADNLVHLGSISAVKRKEALVKNSWRAKLAAYLPGRKQQFKLLRRAIELDRSAKAKALFAPAVPQSVRDHELDRLTRRLLTGQYFMELLTALIDDKPLPAVPFMDDQLIQNRLHFATAQLEKFKNSWREGARELP